MLLFPLRLPPVANLLAQLNALSSCWHCSSITSEDAWSFQYCSNVSWQSWLDPWNSILMSWTLSDSNFKKWGSRGENWVSSIEKQEFLQYAYPKRLLVLKETTIAISCDVQVFHTTCVNIAGLFLVYCTLNFHVYELDIFWIKTCFAGHITVIRNEKLEVLFKIGYQDVSESTCKKSHTFLLFLFFSHSTWFRMLCSSKLNWPFELKLHILSLLQWSLLSQIENLHGS